MDDLRRVRESQRFCICSMYRRRHAGTSNRSHREKRDRRRSRKRSETPPGRTGRSPDPGPEAAVLDGAPPGTVYGDSKVVTESPGSPSPRRLVSRTRGRYTALCRGRLGAHCTWPVRTGRRGRACLACGLSRVLTETPPKRCKGFVQVTDSLRRWGTAPGQGWRQLGYFP